MYRLFVAQDATHYQLYDQDESLEELVKRATKYDEQGLLWIISDESGRPVKFSQVYCQAIDFVVRKFHDRRSGGFSATYGKLPTENIIVWVDKK